MLLIGYTAIYLRLGGNIEHIIDIGLGKNICHQLGIAYIPFDKTNPGIGNLFLDCPQITGISELVQDHYINIVAILFQQVFQEVSPNKTGGTGNQIFFHNLKF